MSDIPSRHIVGDWFDNCSCAIPASRSSARSRPGPTRSADRPNPPGKYPQLMNAPRSETGPGPQLVTWGKSAILSVDAHGFKFEYTLNSAKHIPFDWSGP
ncbi:MAG: hypothetical protein ACJ8AH_00045 [Stellaceae bacterium]